MTWREQPMLFTCAGDTLVGVLARPEASAAETGDTAVVIVVGGPQYRAGSHRHFVHLARALADAGYPALRFDARGMGDASGAQRSFEQLDDDIGAALDALQTALPEVRRVVLWGLCDGASAALLYWQRRRDPRVAGLCLVNPWVRSVTSLARAHVKYYYAQRLLQRDFWLKLVTGKLATRALADLLATTWAAMRPRPVAQPESCATSTPPFQHGMAAGWRSFGGPILLVLSELDYTAKEFLEHVAIEPLWKTCLDRDSVTRVDLQGADHTFSAIASSLFLQSTMVSWLAGRYP